MEDLTNRFDEFFDAAKSVYIELDAEIHTLRLRRAITLDTMEQQKPACKRKMFDPIMQSLIDNLKTRLNCYLDKDSKFSFLVKLNELNSEEMSTACRNIALFYINDIDEKELISECEMAKSSCRAIIYGFSRNNVLYYCQRRIAERFSKH